MTDTPPGSPDSLSAQAHRRLIGLLGLLLPVLLVVMAGIRPTPELSPWKRLDSISAYYYTGAAGVFVGVLFALSLFLLTYPGYPDAVADRVLGFIGGAAALGVALFPTAPPPGVTAAGWWRPVMRVAHYASAVLLFITFALFAIWLFRKSNVPLRQDRPLEKRVRNDVCLVCGLVMIVCILWSGSSMFTNAPIFFPESIAIIAFAVSWLTKGEAYTPIVQAARSVRRRLA